MASVVSAAAAAAPVVSTAAAAGPVVVSRCRGRRRRGLRCRRRRVGTRRFDGLGGRGEFGDGRIAAGTLVVVAASGKDQYGYGREGGKGSSAHGGPLLE